MRLNERDGEELHALLASRGWALFRQLALEMYGDDSIVNDLFMKAHANMDLTELGRHAAVILSTRKALDNLLELPAAAISQIEGEGKHR